jgi:hypothetical protein
MAVVRRPIGQFLTTILPQISLTVHFVRVSHSVPMPRMPRRNQFEMCDKLMSVPNLDEMSPDALQYFANRYEHCNNEEAVLLVGHSLPGYVKQARLLGRIARYLASRKATGSDVLDEFIQSMYSDLSEECQWRMRFNYVPVKIEHAGEQLVVCIDSTKSVTVRTGVSKPYLDIRCNSIEECVRIKEAFVSFFEEYASRHRTNPPAD